MGKVSKATAQSMEANGARVQAWFDGDARYHHTDREYAGTKIPKAVLCWGGTRMDPLVLDITSLPKGFQKKSTDAMLVFWDVDPGDAPGCLSGIELPDLCVGCGSTQKLEVASSPKNWIDTIPRSTTKYRFGSGVRMFGAKYCPDCMTIPTGIDIAHQDRGRFLTVRIGSIESAKAYRAIADANAAHMVPFVEAVFTARIDNRKLHKALKD